MKSLDPDAEVLSRWLVVPSIKSENFEDYEGYSIVEGLTEVMVKRHPKKDFLIRSDIGDRAYVLEEDGNKRKNRRKIKLKSRYQIIKES